MFVISGTCHENMFDCFNDVGACGAFVSIRAMTFEEGLVESGSVEAQARYGGGFGWWQSFFRTAWIINVAREEGC